MLGLEESKTPGGEKRAVTWLNIRVDRIAE
jgi:hypothetical protein